MNGIIQEAEGIMKPGDLISVVIPVYNGERYLAEAIDSVLGQSYPHLELIVVDDGSTDESSSIAQRNPAVRYCRQANSGAAAARNRGIGLAQGDWFAFLDADDLWTAEKLERQLAALQRESAAAAAFGHVEHFFSPEMDERMKAQIRCPTAPTPAYLPGALLVPRSAFFRVGLFDVTLQIGEFVDWVARAKHAGLMLLMLPEVVFRRRVHATNQGRVRRHLRHHYARVCKAALDRQRRHGAHEGMAT